MNLLLLAFGQISVEVSDTGLQTVQPKMVTKYTSVHGKPVQEPGPLYEDFTVGMCDLPSIHFNQLNRTFLMEADIPFIIKGVSENWTSSNGGWSYDTLLKNHGDDIFHLHPHGSNTFKDFMEQPGRYVMGHALYPPGSCYSDPWRPYSPAMLGSLKNEYSIPEMLTPISTLQIGMGQGRGVGVPPENHPSSWFALMSGRKRWVVRPPNSGTSRNGGPGTEPPQSMNNRNPRSPDVCVPDFKPLDALHCDQKEGEILWLPNFWWHETCSVGDFTMGVGGLTTDDCCPEEIQYETFDCMHRDEGISFSLNDITSCTSGTCDTLPLKSGTAPAAF